MRTAASRFDPGARAEAVVFINGIALGGLGITGLWLWWKRRVMRQEAKRKQRIGRSGN